MPSARGAPCPTRAPTGSHAHRGSSAGCTPIRSTLCASSFRSSLVCSSNGCRPPAADRLMTQRITVLLVEDHRLLREGIAAMLSEQADLAVVATGPAREQVLSRVRDA